MAFIFNIGAFPKPEQSWSTNLSTRMRLLVLLAVEFYHRVRYCQPCSFVGDKNHILKRQILVYRPEWGLRLCICSQLPLNLSVAGPQVLEDLKNQSMKGITPQRHIPALILLPAVLSHLCPSTGMGC